MLSIDTDNTLPSTHSSRSPHPTEESRACRPEHNRAAKRAHQYPQEPTCPASKPITESVGYITNATQVTAELELDRAQELRPRIIGIQIKNLHEPRATVAWLPGHGHLCRNPEATRRILRPIDHD